jgi:hypothetical protein
MPAVEVSPAILEFDPGGSFPQSAGRVFILPDFGKAGVLKETSSIVVSVPASSVEGPLEFDVGGLPFEPGSDTLPLDGAASLGVSLTRSYQRDASFEIRLVTEFDEADGDHFSHAKHKLITLSCDATPGDAGGQQVAGEGNEVYVVWSDNRDDPDYYGNRDIYINRSSDGGASWPEEGVRLDSDPKGAGHSIQPQLCVEGGTAYVVWLDLRDWPGEIYFNRASSSAGGGLARVSSDLPHSAENDDADAPQICSAGDHVYVVWQSAVDLLRYEVRFNRSDNQGAAGSWLRDSSGGRIELRLDEGARPYRPNPRICCSGDDVYVAWQTREFAGTAVRPIAFNRSHDGGESWAGPFPVSDAGGDSFELCCDGDQVYIAWAQEDGIRLRRFDNVAKEWSEVVRLSEAGNRGAGLDLCCRGDLVAVVWEDDGGDTHPSRVYFNRSEARGAAGSWLASDLRLDTNPDTVASARSPAIVCDASRYHVVWRNAKAGIRDIQARRIAITAGVDPTVFVEPTSLAPSAQSGLEPSHTEDPRLSSSGDGAFIVWEQGDFRSGESTPRSSVHFNALSEARPQGLQNGDVRVRR